MGKNEELVARIQGAAKGSLDLNSRIWWLTHPSVGPDDGTSVICPAYTASLDAALAMAERMLPGWWVEIACRHSADEHPSQKWSAEMAAPEPVTIVAYGEEMTSREFYHAYAATPSLALCAAVLKALA